MNKKLSIGEAIHLYRKRAGLTQTELAQAAGVSKSTISNYECGITQPKITALLKISTALDIPLSYIVPFISDKDAPARRPQIPVFTAETASLCGGSITGPHEYIIPEKDMQLAPGSVCGIKSEGKIMLFLHVPEYSPGDILLCAPEPDGALFIAQYSGSAFFDTRSGKQLESEPYIIAKYAGDI